MSSNILNNYPTESIPATVGRFCIGVSVAVSYPLYSHPTRQSLMHTGVLVVVALSTSHAHALQLSVDDCAGAPTLRSASARVCMLRTDEPVRTTIPASFEVNSVTPTPGQLLVIHFHFIVELLMEIQGKGDKVAVGTKFNKILYWTCSFLVLGVSTIECCTVRLASVQRPQRQRPAPRTGAAIGRAPPTTSACAAVTTRAVTE